MNTGIYNIKSYINILLRLFVLVAFLLQYAAAHNEERDALRTLKQFHYLGRWHPDPDMQADSKYPQALRMFQMLAGLSITGILDEATIRRMHARRCGLPDIINRGSLLKRRRKRRYVLQGSRWKDGLVSYRYINSPSHGLSEDTVKVTIGRALKTWEDAANLQITEDPNTSDIEISFVSGNHEDGFPLDGPGETLAHAFYPSSEENGGDMHFDDEENWTADGSDGVNLYYVALHELGHSLGLAHSAIRESVMYPWYPEYSPDLQLTRDDKDAIVALYGAKPRATELPPIKPDVDANTTAILRKHFCQNGSVDAVVNVNGRIYVFQGEMYAVLDESGIAPGYPRYIRNDWPDLPSNLDSAQHWGALGIMLFFKGQWYWRYTLGTNNNGSLVRGYPRLIRNDFLGGLPNTLDSVFQWSENGRMYVIKDQKYYRLQNMEVSPNSLEVAPDNWYYNYPQNFPEKWNIHLSQGVADGVQYNGRTFFFSQDQYVRYNDKTYEPDPGYPKNIADFWLGCQLTDSAPEDMEMTLSSRETQFEEQDSQHRADDQPSRASHLISQALFLTMSLMWLSCQ